VARGLVCERNLLMAPVIADQANREHLVLPFCLWRPPREPRGATTSLAGITLHGGAFSSPLRLVVVGSAHARQPTPRPADDARQYASQWRPLTHGELLALIIMRCSRLTAWSDDVMWHRSARAWSAPAVGSSAPTRDRTGASGRRDRA
jgi:hypothetical protein